MKFNMTIDQENNTNTEESDSNEQKLYQYLSDLNIDFEIFEHEEFPTCEASGNFYEERKMGKDCKSIFLRNRKGKKHYLVVLPAEKKIDILFLAEFLEEQPKMGFASDERLKKFLGLKPGSVTPFSLIHPHSFEVTAVFDTDIFSEEYIHFHPLRNSATIKLKTSDFQKFLESLSRDSREIREICFAG